MNIVVLRGTLSKEPEVRELASGSVVISFEVSAPTPGGVSNVPVAWFDPSPVTLDVGDEVLVTGEVRRRFFRAGGVTQSRTEVVAASVIRVSNRRGVRKALAAVAALADTA